MKKIIFHLDDSKNFRGGERQVLYLASELEKLGCRNFVVCRKNSLLEKEAGERRLESFDIPYFSEWDPVSALLLALEIKQKMKAFDADALPIIHSHTGHTAATAWLAGFLLDGVRIAHRRVDFPVSGRSAVLKYVKSDAVIAVSEAIKKILLAGGISEKKIAVIPSSVNLADFESSAGEDYRNRLLANLKLGADSMLIGSLMALVPHKDPLNLVKAAKRTVSARPECHFLLAGEGHLLDEAKTAVKTLSLENNFHFLGYCRENIEFLKGLDIFVLSSREEGLGSSIIEAMAAGLPVVGTDAGGIPELIQNNFNGFITPRESPEPLADALLKLAGDAELRRRFSANSLARSRDYSSVKMAQETLKLYEKTLENFKPR